MSDIFKKISPYEITKNPFKLIDKQWMLVTAGDKNRFNTMTASWGGVGILWGKPVTTVYIRPQRYTYEFMESSAVFTLSFYSEEFRKKLSLCGSKSGRDIDKVKECGFSPKEASNGGIYFEEAELVLSCKKIYFDDIKPDNFLGDDIEKWYNSDYHRMYIAEIQEVLSK